MRTIVAHPLLFSHSATCAIDREPTPNITRNLSGPALNGSVMFRANSASSIWCSAIFMSNRTLKHFYWQYSNGTRLPVVDRGETSAQDVYSERYAGIIGNRTETWIRILHFKSTQPSSAGNYTCAARYKVKEEKYTWKNKSVEVRVTGGWVVHWVAAQNSLT